MHRFFLQRHWKWITPIIIGSIVVFFMSPIGNAVTDIAKVYTDTSIYENALEKAKDNTQVITVLGDLAPIDTFAIVEGAVFYSNNNETVNITVRIKGSKGKGKLDIVAHKVKERWDYELIKIRIKDPKATIVVLE